VCNERRSRRVKIMRGIGVCRARIGEEPMLGVQRSATALARKRAKEILTVDDTRRGTEENIEQKKTRSIR
jgi:hypothetical protein